MVADLVMTDEKTHLENMSNPHPATLSFIQTIVSDLREILLRSRAFTPHEVEAIADVIESELSEFGKLDQKRVASALHAKTFPREKADHIANALVR